VAGATSREAMMMIRSWGTPQIYHGRRILSFLSTGHFWHN
jgi:hypothetical protein